MDDEVSMLRPMGMGDIFDEAFSLYKQNFATFFGIVAIAYIPAQILSELISPTSALTSFDTTSGVGGLEGFLGNIFIFAASAISSAALTKAIADSHLGNQTSIGSAYGNIMARALPLIFTLLLVGIMVGVGTILLLVPGIILAFMSAFVAQVFVVEDRKFFDAFSRSRELAKENWKRIFMIALVSFVIYMIVGFGLFFLIETISSNAIVVGAILGLVFAFVLPIVSSAMVLLYFDIRVRKEGFDLELLANEIQNPGYRQ